ncbi:peroxiredoxin [Bradyrhizobium sp. AZCC 2289]|uniref:peroxiredoxin n=1 Tax=Bradyrhizobium sp. AZCC 2289 TaxID=3117026 RepID=UPI002FEF5FE4
MSKKTRKKSSTKPSKTIARKAAQKATTAKAGRGGSKAPAKPAKKPAAKAGKAVAKKSGKPANSASAKASHTPASKPLKSEQSASPNLAVEGAKAPAFHLPRDGGDHVSLADYAGKKLVLFFYPRADTPGCTREAIDFTRLKGAFAESGTEVLGISADTVKAQESFKNKHELSIPLISDEQHEMLEAYGAWGEKSMYGRTFLGILRTTVLIGADGRVTRIWRNVRVDGHADEVLAAAQAL